MKNKFLGDNIFWGKKKSEVRIYNCAYRYKYMRVFMEKIIVISPKIKQKFMIMIRYGLCHDFFFRLGGKN